MNLKNYYKITLLITALSLLTTVNAEQHNHHNSLGAITLNNGNKWAIDNSLHIGMTSIKSAIEANIDAIHLNTFKDEQYHKLASNIEQHLNYLFNHCKLPSDADEQLHVLLYSIMQGAKAMTTSENKRAGAIEIINALQRYPQYFEDTQWQPLQH